MRFYKLLLALPVMMTGFAMDAMAGNCKPMSCDPRSYDTSELLETKNGYTRQNLNDQNNSKVYSYFEGKRCFYCGTEEKGSGDGCNFEDIVMIPDGVNFGAYRCFDDTGADDDWLRTYAKEWCGDAPIKAEGVANALYPNYVTREKQGGNSVKVTSPRRVKAICKWNECKKGYIARDNKCISPDAEDCDRTPNAKWSGSSCICQETGRYWDKSKKYCATEEECRTGQFACLGININVNNSTTIGDISATTGNVTQQQQQQQQQKNNSDNTTGDKTGGKTGGGSGGGRVANGGRTTPNGIACWNMGKETMYESSTDTCICVVPGTKTPDTTKEFRIEGGKGVCKDKSAPVVAAQCNCTNIAIVNVANTTCGAKNAQLASAVAQINQQCSNAATCDGKVFEMNLAVVNAIMAQPNCGIEDVQPAKPVINEKRLAAAVEAIDKYRSGLDVSVWKDEEGNFNTARLVSDSIAGVVLGTAGGLITSSVVKKNQVKSGFEDIMCTIGGQPVGSYGDEIQVGIQ